MTLRAPGAAIAATLLCCPLLSVAQSLPANFVLEDVAPNETFTQPVALDFAADGRIFVVERRGRVYILEPDPMGANPKTDYIKVTPPFFNLEAEVLNHWDRGLLGFALDPDFLNNGHVYVAYEVETNAPTPDVYQWSYGRVERFTRDSGNPDVIDTSTRVTLVGETWPLGPVSAHFSHTQGRLVFGDDGTLIFSHGDGAHFDGAPDGGGRDPNQFLPGRSNPIEDIGAFRSQFDQSLSGKIIRIDPATGDGIPSNPFYNALEPRSAQSRIWAMGLRNPYRLDIRRGSGSTNPADGTPGTLYATDVGSNRREELNRIDGGENFGWPCYEGRSEHTGFQGLNPPYGACPPDDSGMTPPLVDWAHNYSSQESYPIPGFVGDAATGAAYHEGGSYPSSYTDGLFFCDYPQSWIRFVKFDGGGGVQDVVPFAGNLGLPVELRVDPLSQDLFYISYADQQIRRFVYTGDVGTGTPPSTPLSSVAFGGPASVELTWAASPELDIAGYNVYRSNAPGGAQVQVNTGLVTATQFVDDGTGAGALSNGTTYYYRIEGVDDEAMTSAPTADLAVIPTSKAWEWYVPRPGPSLESTQAPAPFPRELVLPAAITGSDFNHRNTRDRAPQLRRDDMGDDDWTLQTRIDLTQFTADTDFHAGIMVQVSQYDMFLWGFYRGTDLRLERTGYGELGSVSQAATEVSLRVVKTGHDYSYEWRTDDALPWNVGEAEVSAASIDYVGLAVRTWEYNAPLTVEVDYLALNELSPVVGSITPTPASGPAPLQVQFNAVAYDPDGDVLTYDWDFGDGSGSDKPAPVHTYQVPGSYQPTLTVRDGSGLQASLTLTEVLAEGNQPPTATILTPADGTEYADASAAILLGGQGLDVEDASPSLTFDWSVDLHHGATFTPGYLTPPSGESSSFVPNTVDDGQGIWLDVILTVTDTGGLSDADTLQVFDRVLPPVAVLELDPARADGLGAPAVPGAASPWADLGDGPDATLLGMGSFGPSSGWNGTGLLGDPYRLTLDGMDDLAAVAAGAVPELQGLGAASLEIWARPGSDVTSRQYLVEWLASYAVPFPGLTLAIFNEELQLYLQPWRTIAPISPDRWTHVVLVKDGNDWTAYLDGELVAAGAGANLGDQVSELVVGAGTFPGPGVYADHFGGDVGEVRAFDFALSPANVSVLYAQGMPTFANPPRLDAITPSAALADTAGVAVTLDGQDFGDGASVRLVRSGKPDVVASAVQVHGGGTQITGHLSLLGADTGWWDVVVVNPDTQASTLVEGFEILAPSAVFLELTGAAADGVGPPMVPGTGSPWVDLEAAVPADLLYFAGDATSGWQGSGIPGDPYRLRFDGVDDVVRIAGGSVPGLQGVSTLTVEAWVTLGNDVQTLQTIAEWVSQYATPWPGMSMVVYQGQIFVRLGHWQWLAGVGSVSPGQNVYVALAYDGSGIQASVNGTTVTVPLTNLGDQVSELTLGASTYAAPGLYQNHFAGDLAVFRLSDRALTVEQMGASYLAGLAMFTPDPMATIQVGPATGILDGTQNFTFDLNYTDGGGGFGVRGCSLQLTYDPAAFGVVSVVEGALLSGAGNTFFAADTSTPGTILIDASILGASAGNSADGPLATVTMSIQGGAVDDDYDLDLTVMELVDVSNPPMSVPHVSADGTRTLDTTAPTATTGVTALALHEGVRLGWTPPPDDYDGVTLFTRPWTLDPGAGYPEFDDLAGAPAWPVDLTEARNPAHGWVETILDAGTNPVDLSEVARSVVSAVILTRDAAGNLSDLATAPRVRLPNYRLGDVGLFDAEGIYQPIFDGVVDGTNDLPVLSSCYGATAADPWYIAACDIGPTDTADPDGVPATDDLIGFEDLMIFAQTFGLPAKAEPVPRRAHLAEAAADQSLRLATGPPVQLDGTAGAVGRVEVPLLVGGNARGLKGLHLRLGFDPRRLRLHGVRPADALARGDARVIHYHYDRSDGAVIDLAALGAEADVVGDGVLLTLTFEVLGARGGSVVATEVSVRGIDGSTLVAETADLGVNSLVPAPPQYSLQAAYPNPFNPATTLRFETPRAGRVRLRIYDVAGRMVRTLVSKDMEAGYHSVVWSGTDDRGRGVATGVYLYELVAPEYRSVKKMMLVK